MNNIFKYIREYGNKNIYEENINEVDILIFSQIPYINFDKINIPKEGITILELYKKVKEINIDTKSNTSSNTLKILERISTKKRYKDFIVKDYEHILNDDTQFGALTIIDTKNNKYIVFKGTDGSISGWKENLELSYNYPTDSQLLAGNYLNKHIKLTDEGIIICGHSKGGNLALTGSIRASTIKKTKIKKIYSFDSPGLRDEEIKSLKYKLIKNKLINIVPDLSLIGVLLNQENIIVIESTAVGLKQHDVITWTINNNKLKRVVRDSLSKKLEKGIKKLLKKYSYEEREKITNDIFKVFEENNIKSLNDINNIKALYQIIKSSLSISKDTKEVLIEIIKLLIKDISIDIINKM